MQGVGIEEEKWDVRFIQQLKEFGNQASVKNSGAAMKWEKGAQRAQLWPVFLAAS